MSVVTTLSALKENSPQEFEVDGIDVISLPLAYSNRDSLLRRGFAYVRFALRDQKSVV